MKNIRLLAAVLPAMLLLTGSVSGSEQTAPEISAKCAIVMDADTGSVLYEKAADTPMLIASTTKIMTAMIALENLDLDRTVTVEPEWAGIEGSSMYLAPGQKLTVRELLYGLMLASGNDAATALAYLTAGSEEAFSAMMNRKAAELGCEHTCFDNPSGFDSPDHHSCARDMAKIARAAIQLQELRQIAGTTQMTVGGLTYTNHNKLLTRCEGVFGLKTGYTMAAGRTLVTCCERMGRTLICVTLSDPNDWDDHMALYDWAYGLRTQRAGFSSDMRWTVPVIGGDAGSVGVSPAEELTVYAFEDDVLTANVTIPRFVYADVTAGEQAGTASVLMNGEETASVELVYTETVKKMRSENNDPVRWLNALSGLLERKLYSVS